MRISRHVTEMLDISGWYIDRLADISVAREHGDITESEYVQLRDHYLSLWQRHRVEIA